MICARHAAASLFVAAMLGCPRNQDEPPENDTGTATDSAEEGESGTGDPCVGPDGCWDCEPMQSDELLDACTDATCEKFSNTTERLPLLDADGSLPPIP